MAKQISAIDRANGSWDKYFNTLKKGGQGYVVDYIKNTQDLSKVTGDDLVQANQNAREAAIAHNTALEQQTLGAKAASVAMKGLALVGNIALSMLASFVVSKVIEDIDNFIHKSEKLKESLEESVSVFDETTDEVKDLEEQIDECTAKIEELQKLADNGSISIMDEEQLRLLKDENAELEKNLALKKDKQIRDAQDVLADAENNVDQKVRSQYEYDYSYDNFGEAFGDGFKLWIAGTPVAEQITPEEELVNAVNAYKNHYENYGWVDEAASDRAAEMYALISPSIEAYEKLIAAGYELNDTEQTRYNQLKESQSAYLEHLYLVRGTATEFKALNAEQQRYILLNRLIKQGLSEDVAKAIIGSIPDEDLDKYWDKDFSFVPPEMKDGETAEEYGKRYAEAWAKGLEKGAKSSNETTESIEDLNKEIDGIQDAYSTLEKAVDEYNKTGGMSVDTLQDLLSMSPEYLACLRMENGQLKVDTQAYIALAQAKLYSMMASLEAEMASTQALIDEGGEVDHLIAKYKALALAKGAAEKAIANLSEVDLTSGGSSGGLSGRDERAENMERYNEMLEDYNDKVADTNERLAELAKEEHLDLMVHKIETVANAIQELDDVIDILDTALDMTFEGDYQGQIKIITAQMETAKIKGQEMREEFERLCDIQPISADEAKELADRMGELGESIRENYRALVEYRSELIALRVEALTSLGAGALEQVERASSMLERNMETLEKGGLTGLQFNILPNIPKSAVEKQRAENDKLIKEQERYYDEISEIRQKALDMELRENQEERAKERAKLMEDLADAKAELDKFYEENIANQKDNVSSEGGYQKQSIDQGKSYSEEVQKILDGIQEYIKNNPVLAPSLDAEGWESFVQEVNAYFEKVGKTENPYEAFNQFMMENYSSTDPYSNDSLFYDAWSNVFEEYQKKYENQNKPDTKEESNKNDEKSNKSWDTGFKGPAEQFLEDRDKKYDDSLKKSEKSQEKHNENIEEEEERHGENMADIQDNYQNSSLESQDEFEEASETSLEESNDAKEVEITEFTTAAEGIITEFENWIASNPISAPPLDQTSWGNMLAEVAMYCDTIAQMINGISFGGFGGITGGVPLSESNAAANIQGGTNCVKYLRARLGEYGINASSALTQDSMAKTYGYNLEGAVDDPSLFPSVLTTGATIVLANGKARNAQGELYGHVIFVEFYDPITGMLGYTDNTTGQNVKVVNFSEWSKQKTITRIVPPWAYTQALATGTPQGNALAKNLGIAGENYKPEILVDKETGEFQYIDEPTIIDPSKTDVIGEKATASMPKFASGTLSNPYRENSWEVLGDWAQFGVLKFTEEDLKILVENMVRHELPQEQIDRIIYSVTTLNDTMLEKNRDGKYATDSGKALLDVLRDSPLVNHSPEYNKLWGILGQGTLVDGYGNPILEEYESAARFVLSGAVFASNLIDNPSFREKLQNGWVPPEGFYSTSLLDMMEEVGLITSDD